MRFINYAIIALIGFSLFATLLPISTLNGFSEPNNESPSGTNDSPDFRNIEEVNDGRFTISQTTHEGVIDPVSMLQSGYQTTELTSARTDTGTNTAGNITIDEANGWFVNSTEVEVTNLRRLYGVNGTFDNGTDPWATHTYNGGGNTQIDSYNSTGGFIVCKNMGSYNPSGGGYYTHSQYSEAGWEQVVTNTPESLTFRMEFNFRYVTGPLDPEGDDSFAGDVGVFWQLGTEGYYYPLQNYDSRETWYSVSYVFAVSPGLSSFTISLGLYIGAGNVRVYINNDYDDDGVADGAENAQNATLYIDNVEFTSTTPPGFEDVNLTFHAGALSAPILGTGTGTGKVSNPDYWNVTPLEYQITASANVLFTYSVTSLFQRNINSSWTTDLSKSGVAYSIFSGQSANLAINTYITQPSGYFDSTFDIIYPKDWENTTIWDPLMNNITSNCVLAPGQIHIPTSELSRSGWWKIDLNGPNYAKNVSVQAYNPGNGLWLENSLFRPGNDTRIQAEIGTASATPLEGDPVNITWVLPNDNPWAFDSITTMLSGAITSSTWTFGSSNTTAGEWSIDILWTNGTEIAFRSVSFDLYHSASIVATYPTIKTDYGQIISNLITLKDADTNQYLLDDSVTMEANWSSSVISFAQNYAKKWWEADFNTSLVSEGQFVVLVNASRPYFDDVSTQFIVIATQQTTFEILNAGAIPIETGQNEIFTVQMEYELPNGTGVPGANIYIGHSGPGGGLLWYNFVDDNDGHYSVDIVCNISATYPITITLNKTYYHSASDSFTLIVTEIPTLIAFEGDVSSAHMEFEKDYQLIVHYYRVDSETPMDVNGANVSVIAQDPGLQYEINEVAGYYVITISGHATGTWSLTISAHKTNHHVATKQFLFTVEKVPISVEILEGNDGLELASKTLMVRVTETDSGNPVSGLSVFYRIIIRTPNGFAENPVALTESATPGVYVASITMPDADETYYIRIFCEAENYALAEPFLASLIVTRSFTTALMLYSTRYWWAILGVVAIVGAVGYRRSARRRRVKQNKIALAVKRRFDDVRSLLGVIVLHKDSGLPVYSKILREGLEEAVISAFITAITTFRGEFDIETTTEEWGLIPISDIVRVISTNKLICAFITTGNPSAEQRERMIQFAKTVGFIFDESMEDVPVVILDHHTTKRFDGLFDDILDGALLRTYTLDEAKKFPTSTCADERIARKQGEEFKLEELASEIAACGLEEGRVYQAIMKALENHLLVTTDESPYTTEIIRAPEIAEEES
jgi:hypothetical protein